MRRALIDVSLGGLFLLALVVPAAANAEVAPDPSMLTSWAENWFGPVDRCDAELDVAPSATPVRERLVCTGNPALDDPTCFASDPQGIPTSSSSPTSAVRLRAASVGTLHLDMPVASEGAPIVISLLGPAGEHRLGLDRPPRR